MEGLFILKLRGEKMKNNIKKIILSGVNAYSASISQLENLFPNWEQEEIQHLYQAGASPAWWNAKGEELGVEFEFLPLEGEA